VRLRLRGAVRVRTGYNHGENLHKFGYIAPMFMSSTFSWICIFKWSFSHGCVRGSRSVEASPNANPLQPYKVTSGSQTWQWDILINISILCFCFWRSSVVAAFSEYSVVRRSSSGLGGNVNLRLHTYLLPRYMEG
jgi:hypothetical protein